MATKAPWHSRINEIAEEVRILGEPMIGAARLQALLNVSPRASQTILAPLVTERRGKAGLAPAAAVLAALRALAGGLDAEQEQHRRAKLGAWLRGQEKAVQDTPRLLVEAHPRVTGARLDAIPGLELGPGRLTLTFGTAEEAAQRLLALAMAIGRDLPEFERRVSTAQSPSSTMPNSSAQDSAA